MLGRPCGITDERGRDCPDRSVSGSPLNLCGRHLRQAAELYSSLDGLDPGTRLREACPSCNARALVAYVATRTTKCAVCGYAEKVEPELIPRPDRTKIAADDPVVYYIRFGDRIKIGTTGDLRGRMSALPHDEVLAIERGDRDLERERHGQFAHLRLTPRGEWFRTAPDLLAHIDTLKAST